MLKCRSHAVTLGVNCPSVEGGTAPSPLMGKTQFLLSGTAEEGEDDSSLGSDVCGVGGLVRSFEERV